MFLILIPIVFLLTTFLGFVIHWFFHQPFAGRFYKAHLNHHEKQYPPNDLVSDEYRNAGKDNTVFLFLIIAAPILITIVLMMIFSVIPFILGLLTLIEVSVIGYVYNAMHDAFHLRKSVWNRFPGFEKLRMLHFIHHQNMKVNFSIFWFFWDRVFGSFLDRKE
jgi:sterol desaturase/sphingolipid hydroxylase (fatty acid hydroxylase superfamily)